MILKNIPNALTISRLFLIWPFLYFIFSHEFKWAFYIFLFAGFTDGLDGFLARYFNWLTPLGSFLDPLADKLLIAASFISLALLNQLPWWLMVLVFLRDLTISLGVIAWYVLIRKKISFKPTKLSKCNTIFQLTLVTLCLFELAYFQLVPHLVTVLIGLTAITTSVTFFDYVWTWAKKAVTNTHFLS